MYNIQNLIFFALCAIIPQSSFCQQKATETNQIQTTLLSKNSLKLTWDSSMALEFEVRIKGLKTQANSPIRRFAASSQEQEMLIDGLESGAIYAIDIQGFSNGVSFLEQDIIATESQSTGEIQTYFTRDIDESAVLPGSLPTGVGWNPVRNAILDRIHGAKKTIDVMMYNNNRGEFVDALKAAVNRGVVVRYIADEETFNAALNNLNFPVFYDLGSSIMHNKAVVVDAESLNPNDCYVLTGSMNWTTEALADQYNNLLVIQDQALARGYTLEFEEMWGSASATPNPNLARFGLEKTVNTPRFYTIGGIPVECYFSPSDGTTAGIEKMMNTADEQFYFALLLFTNYTLSDKCIELAQQGIDIQGIIDDIEAPSSQYEWLSDRNVAVQWHADPTILHHKYSIVDPFFPNSDPTVETGSHNWTFSAETKNDENTLVIHDADITAQFYRDYSARKKQSPVKTIRLLEDKNLISLFPNPSSTFIQLENLPKDALEFRCVDILGQKVLRENAKSELDIQYLPSGSYFLQIQTKNGRYSLPFQKI